MKQSDRDLLIQQQIEIGERNIILLERQIEISEQNARSSQVLSAALAAPEKRRCKEEQDATHPPLRIMFGGQRGAITLLKSIPGFADLWQKEVPEEYLETIMDRAGEEWHLINCPCNERPLVQSGGLTECGCARWFFSTGKSVRVHRFPVSCEDGEGIGEHR